MCTISTAVLFFGVCTAVLTFGRYKINTFSVASAVVVCIIGTAVVAELIFGLCRHKISTN